MENGPFEDVFPIRNGDIPLLCLFTGGYQIQSFFTAPFDSAENPSGVGESYNSRFVAFTAPDEVKPSSHSS